MEREHLTPGRQIAKDTEHMGGGWIEESGIVSWLKRIKERFVHFEAGEFGWGQFIWLINQTGELWLDLKNSGIHSKDKESYLEGWHSYMTMLSWIQDRCNEEELLVV